jgi:hypothetical protein
MANEDEPMRPTAKQKTANLKSAAICLLMSPSPSTTVNGIMQ